MQNPVTLEEIAKVKISSRNRDELNVGGCVHPRAHLSGRQQCWSPRRLTKAHAAPLSGSRTRLALWLTVVDVW